jgi:putative DNA primase/helicase
VDVVDLNQLPQLDESTHLIALMTAVCRPCLTLAPGFLYNASAVSGAGTGKGLLLKSACVVANGSQPSAMSAGHCAEELDKRLVSAAIAAQPAIYLDNFNEGVLANDTLASFLTEDPARVRVLGQSKLVPLNTRAFVAITGNAVQISEDMARRILQVGLDARADSDQA